MNHLRLFRSLVWVHVGLTLLGILASLRLEKTLPAPLQAYLQAEKDAPMITREIAVGTLGLTWMAVMVVAWIALLRFWRIAPWLYLATCGGAVVLALGAGPSVETAIETGVNTAWSFVGGFILAMAFVSDVAARFRAKPNPDL